MARDRIKWRDPQAEDGDLYNKIKEAALCGLFITIAFVCAMAL